MDIALGIGEYAVSNRPEDVLKTYALGSCVALLMYQPGVKLMAMAHIALPDSRLSPELARRRPAYFADTAVALLIHKIAGEYRCPFDRLIVGMIGGAEALSAADVFQVGTRNLAAIETALRQYRLRGRRIDTGGLWARSVAARVADGEVSIYLYPMG
ncbi:MAG TPA: chemotaxis protein CheD [Selenomonadales bacterium]|nr:chemotaxis protein CheD [Selenomonadales bacterium]